MRGMMRLVGLGGWVLGASCGFDPAGLGPETGETAAQPAQAPSPGPAPPSGAEQPASTVLRVQDLDVKRLTVGVLFARKVEAKNGTIATAGPPLPAAELQAQLGPEDVDVPELTVDVLYARVVKANVVQVGELHVVEMKIGKDDDSDD